MKSHEMAVSSDFSQSLASGRSTTHRVGGASKPATQSDLLNASKDEVFKKVDQMYRDLDEYELETEEACPVFQNMALQAFLSGLAIRFSRALGKPRGFV